MTLGSYKLHNIPGSGSYEQLLKCIFEKTKFKSSCYPNGKYRSKCYMSQISSFKFPHQLGNFILP